MKQEDSKNSRRDFVKTAAVAAASFMIVPRHVLGGKGFVAPSDKLLIAGVGVGGKGQSDLTGFAKNPKAEIAFLCDVDDRRAANSVKAFPKAKYYKDWREMFDKERRHFDAVSVSTPDHNHAIVALAAMRRRKHVYVQKPLTHDIYEARILTEAAKKYKVVTQMGNQGSSSDGSRSITEWYAAGLIGEVHTVYCWTNRPIWPQGIPWPAAKSEVPKELDWDLWLGTAPRTEYVDKLVPFNWRGWWEYGTGAIGDMGCHMVDVPFKTLGLTYATDVDCSVGSVYLDQGKRGYFPDSCPPSSHVTMTINSSKQASPVRLHWMDGGIQPDRPVELGPEERFGDGGNGVLFIGSKGKLLCDAYGRNPRLLPLSKMDDLNVPETLARVPGQEVGHYTQWVDASIAGYGKMELSSDFSISGPLTEALLVGNLAIRAYDIQVSVANSTNFQYPGRNRKFLWDSDNMKVTNFDLANQFVKREYREGWKVKGLE
ncbi:Gfo/Idh/MocA family oxidoreductase [Daejeonella sp.]|uniref:Gfo/Idh/MocA family protein n=1 Tax=Daejeonella sp. TaxID=2805397 RepID=UPI0030C4D98A